MYQNCGLFTVILYLPIQHNPNTVIDSGLSPAISAHLSTTPTRNVDLPTRIISAQNGLVEIEPAQVKPGQTKLHD